MRVTAATKEATRQGILEAADALFREQGFDATTTRDLARRAGVAGGTLFNYFASKEALATRLVADAWSGTEQAFARRRRPGASLIEDLFLYVSTGLRRLKTVRHLLPPVLETQLAPTSQGRETAADQIRTAFLETLAATLARHRPQTSITAVQTQMYWLLITGILGHWAVDDSPQQEDSLALLDQSLHMFVAWLDQGPRDTS